MKLGEEYSIGLSKGYVGTMWWCWGDLKKKKSSGWRKGWDGYNLGGVEKPRGRKGGEEEAGWVVG